MGAPQVIDVPGHGPVEFPGDMTDEQIVAAIKKNSMVPKPASKFGAADALAGQEAMFNQATGAVATPLSGIVGLAGSMIPGPQGQGADWASRIQNALTYQPRTELGKKAVEVASLPGQAIGWLGNKVGEPIADAGFPLLGAYANGAINAAPTAMALRSSTPTGRLAAEQAQNVLRDSALSAAQDAGAVVPPSAVKGGFLTNILESAAGKAAMNQESSAINQKVWNRLARETAGLPDNQAISTTALESRRGVLSGPYREAAAIDPAVASDIRALSDIRADARDAWRAYNGPTGRSADRRLAQQLDTQATSIEGQIEAAANNAGIPGLVDRLSDARRSIAQTHEIERALNVATGDVSAPILGRSLDKGSPLSGNLETIARFQQAFPKYAADGAAIPTPGVSKLNALASIALGLGGNAAMPGVGMAAAVLPFLSEPIRKGLLSQAGQRMLATPDYAPFASDPYLRGILATSAAQPRQ